MLGSGFFGTVVSVGDDTLELELAPGTTVKVARQAVVKVLDPDRDARPRRARRAQQPGDVDDDRDQPGDERHP